MDRVVELRTFVAILDGGSLAAAARSLNRSPPAVTRILADLEARVGVSLLERTSRRCRPTDAGQRLGAQARHILASYDEALGEASGEARAPRGPLRMTAPLLFGRDHVAPALPTFLDLFPAITIDLQLADRVIDLSEEDVDLALRIGRVTDPSLVTRKLGTVRRLTLASPAYLAHHGVPERPEDLAAHAVIDHRSPHGAPAWQFAGSAGKSVSVAVAPRLTVNQAEVAINLGREGRGVVTAFSYQVLADLESGRLVRLLRAYEPEAMPVSLVYPETRRTVRRLRLLIDHLAAHFERSPVFAPAADPGRPAP